MRLKPNSPFWLYLESLGVLEHGTDEEIKEAKRQYRKKYHLQYKQNQRQHKPEFVINLSKENGEYHRVLTASKAHHLSVSAFIQKAVFAYMENRYLVPNPLQVALLEQLLADCLNEVKTILNTKERFFWESERKLENIEKSISQLQVKITELFRNPPLAPTHDHQNQISQKTDI
jgi:hypothetical protein